MRAAGLRTGRDHFRGPTFSATRLGHPTRQVHGRKLFVLYSPSDAGAIHAGEGVSCGNGAQQSWYAGLAPLPATQAALTPSEYTRSPAWPAPAQDPRANTRWVPRIRFDPLAPDFDRFPRARTAVAHVVECGEGDTLIVPSLWFHYAISLTQSAASTALPQTLRQ